MFAAGLQQTRSRFAANTQEKKIICIKLFAANTHLHIYVCSRSAANTHWHDKLFAADLPQIQTLCSLQVCSKFAADLQQMFAGGCFFSKDNDLWVLDN